MFLAQGGEPSLGEVEMFKNAAVGPLVWKYETYGAGIEDYAQQLTDLWGCAWNFKDAGEQALEDWVRAELVYRTKVYTDRAQVVAWVRRHAASFIGANAAEELVERLSDPALGWGERS